MSEWIYANFYKEDGVTTIAQNIYTQLDKMDAKEASDYHGVDPHFVYRMYTKQLPTANVELLQQRFYVVDQKTIDTKTSQLRKYLIVSDPQVKQLMMEWSWVAYRMRGT